MKAIPYETRLALSTPIPAEGQLKVMSRIPQFMEAETVSAYAAPKEAPRQLKSAVFNMEHGNRFQDIVAFMQECPEMQDLDILFANELDDGTLRSGNVNTAEIISGLLQANYCYGLEFIELVDSRDEKGYEGNAIFSRWPIVKAEAFYVPEAYNWYFDEQKRIGGRVDIFAELDIHGTHVGAICVHLENRCASAGRAGQIAATLAHAREYFGDIPVLIGGDCNTYAFNDCIPMEARTRLDAIRAGIPCVKAEEGEALFTLLEQAGYDYRNFNGTGLSTRRKPMADGDLELHLDWIFGKGLTCVEHGLVSTLIRDCTWASDASPLKKADYRQLSDHNAVYAICALPEA